MQGEEHMRDTIDMAREVESEVGFMWCVNFIELARFEALVRADEREAYAKVCDDMVLYTGYDCAAAIRTRGQG
jgi:hypothetical protein